jgi:2,4-dienoyl-CoA reductase-like NADH-dependent reductase (Old Yellow Enzyme family)
MLNDALFTPFACKSLKMRNRIVMSPMGRSSAPGGVPVEQAVAYYSARAAGGAGLVMSEATAINRPAARNDPSAPDFHGPALDRWREVLHAVHDAGAAMAQQLWHVGAMLDPRFNHDVPYESPSGLMGAKTPNGHAMSEEDIADTIAAYGKAARSAKDGGWDMIEVHGGHSYLIDQFFWAVTNQRQDRYGGSLAERTLFAAEVLRAIRAAVGPEMAISLRISQWKQVEYTARIATTPAELEQWVTPLAEAGVDILHCSQRRYWEPEFPGSDLNFAGWVKKLTGLPTITVGSVSLDSDLQALSRGEGGAPVGIEPLIERLERGDFDLVAVGRAMIANRDWADRIRCGETIEPFAPMMLAKLD